MIMVRGGSEIEIEIEIKIAIKIRSDQIRLQHHICTRY